MYIKASNLDMWIEVDAEDYDSLIGYSWRVQKTKGKLAVYYASNYKVGAMHRFILGITDPRQLVDHADCNGLNNRRSNLRPCDWAQNAWNRRSGGPGKCGFRGVWLDDRRLVSRYCGEVFFYGKRFKKRFKTAEEASIWREQKAQELYGEFYRPCHIQPPRT